MKPARKEIVEALRGGAGVAYAQDVPLFVRPEMCAAAADQIDGLYDDVVQLKHDIELLRRKLGALTDEKSLSAATEAARRELKRQADLNEVDMKGVVAAALLAAVNQ